MLYGNVRPPLEPVLEKCPISACELSYERSKWKEADLLVILHDSLYPTEPRPPGQAWIIHIYESPTFHALSPSLGDKVRESSIFYLLNVHIQKSVIQA